MKPTQIDEHTIKLESGFLFRLWYSGELITINKINSIVKNRPLMKLKAEKYGGDFCQLRQYREITLFNFSEIYFIDVNNGVNGGEFFSVCGFYHVRYDEDGASLFRASTWRKNMSSTFGDFFLKGGYSSAHEAVGDLVEFLNKNR